MGLFISIGVVIIIAILVKVVRDLKTLNSFHQGRKEDIKKIIKEAGKDDNNKP